jgi:competence protein ComEC
VESVLERERAQLPPWVVVGFGAGIAAWFALDGPRQWIALICLAAGTGVAGFAVGGGRLERAFGWLGLTAAIGCALIWARAEWVAAPRLDRPKVVAFDASVERVETLAAEGKLRAALAQARPEGARSNWRDLCLSRRRT